MKRQLISLFALLLTAAGGAAAQNTDGGERQLTRTSLNTWTLDAMPDADGVLEVTFREPSRLDSVPQGWTVKAYGETLAWTAYEGNATMGYVMVPAGAPVTVTPNVRVGSMQARYGVRAEAPANVLVTDLTLNKTATTIMVGNSETLSVTAVTPDDATDQTVTWSSDNEAVATVGASTGEVTAVAAGTANITATANDGSGVTATCAVTVDPQFSFSKQDWYSVESAPANFISVSQAGAKAAADAEKTNANAPGYVCIYALEGGQYKWIDSHGRTGQNSDIEDIVHADAWDEVYSCHSAGSKNSIWFTVSQ